MSCIVSTARDLDECQVENERLEIVSLRPPSSSASYSKVELLYLDKIFCKNIRTMNIVNKNMKIFYQKQKLKKYLKVGIGILNVYLYMHLGEYSGSR